MLLHYQVYLLFPTWLLDVALRSRKKKKKDKSLNCILKSVQLISCRLYQNFSYRTLILSHHNLVLFFPLTSALDAFS